MKHARFLRTGAPKVPPAVINAKVLKALQWVSPLWAFLAERYRGQDVQTLLAQDGLCGICHHPLPMEAIPLNDPESVTADHVWPLFRSLRERARHPEGRAAMIGNKLLTHQRCNRAKAHRAPTGCELVTLASVNARLHLANGCAFAAEPSPWRYRGPR